MDERMRGYGWEDEDEIDDERVRGWGWEDEDERIRMRKGEGVSTVKFGEFKEVDGWSLWKVCVCLNHGGDTHKDIIEHTI